MNTTDRNTLPDDSSRNAHHRQLRKVLRQRRQLINPYQQRCAAYRIKRKIVALPEWQGAKYVALYRANDGEVDPRLLIHLAWQQNKHVFMPVLHPFKAGVMLFMRITLATVFERNRWGIQEPRLRLSDCIASDQLDLVLVPLVGFDREGRRLGMGKGFYDRAFASRITGKRKPVLVGLGHRCQEVSQGEIFEADWDVRLDKLVAV